MASLRIVAFCILAAVVYGITHDQVTARVCVEYFTIGHPPVFPTESPTLLALGWGVIATWWMGLILGIPLAFAARAGKPPKRDVPDLLRPVATLLLVMAGTSLVAGIAGYFAARAGWVWLAEPLATDVPRAKHVRFLADLWAHLAAYATGFFGGLFVIGQTWWRRGRMRRETAAAKPSKPVTAELDA